MAAVAPTLQALVLCDGVYADRGTGKFVIAGTFTRISALSFPAIHPSCWLYARLLGTVGESTLRFRVVDLSTADALGESGPLRLEIADRVRGHEVGIQIPPMKYEHPGAYSIELLWGENRVVLGDWRYELAKSKPG